MIKLLKWTIVFVLAARGLVWGASGDSEDHRSMTVRDKTYEKELIAAVSLKGLQEIIIGPIELTKEVEQNPLLKSLKIEIENEALCKWAPQFICPANCPDLIHLRIMHWDSFVGISRGYEEKDNDVIFLDVSRCCDGPTMQRFLLDSIPMLFPELRSVILGGSKFYNDPDRFRPIMKIMEAFCKKYPQLQSLSLDFMNDDMAALLQHLPKLEQLVMKNAYRLSGIGLSAIGEHCKLLKHVDLSAKKFLAHGLSEQDLEAFLRQCPQLEFLNVTGRETLSSAFLKRISADYPNLVIYCGQD